MNYWPYIIELMFATLYTMDSVIEKDLIDKDIDVIRHFLLMEIRRIGGTCLQEDLIRHSTLPAGSINRYLEKLEEAGMITRDTAAVSTKRRVALADSGKAYTAGAFTLLSKGEEVGCTGMTAEQKERFISYLKVFYVNTREGKPSDLFLPEGWPPTVHYLVMICEDLRHNAYGYQKADGVESFQKYILLQLYHKGGEEAYATIADPWENIRTDVLPLVKKLEKKGLLTRDKSKLLKLTQAGTDYSVFLLNRYALGEELGCNGISEPERSEFLELMTLFFRNLHTDVQNLKS